MSPLVNRARTAGPDPQYPSSSDNIARPVALLFGIFYLAGGIISFAVTGLSGGFTGFVSSTGSVFLGIHINPFHNVVHIGIGAILILASRVPDATITQGVLLGVAVLYVAATLLGFLGKLPIIAVTTASSPDNFFHLFSAAVMLFGGLAGAAQQHQADAQFFDAV